MVRRRYRSVWVAVAALAITCALPHATPALGQSAAQGLDAGVPDGIAVVPSPRAPAAEVGAGPAIDLLPQPPAASVRAPSLEVALGGPTASAVLDDYVLPRIKALVSAALALQNAVVRVCATGTPNAERAATIALDATAVAAARAIVVDTMRPEATEIAVRVLIPVADTETSGIRIDAISSGTVAAPADLATLALEEPGLTGLPTLELLLRRIAVSPTKERCTLARTVAAHVTMAAVRRERAFRAGAVAPHWAPSEAADPRAGRQRMRDLVEALILTLDRMDRELASFAARPSGNRALPFRAGERMRAFLSAKTLALVDHVRLLRLYAGDGSEAATVLAEIEATLDRLGGTLETLTGRERPVEVLAGLVAAQTVALARLPAALGFDPSALRQPIGAYDASRGLETE